MFVFNSPDRSISVYDLYTVCNGCGYRGAYNDICPECGRDFLNYFGNDTTIYIDKENFGIGGAIAKPDLHTTVYWPKLKIILLDGCSGLISVLLCAIKP